MSNMKIVAEAGACNGDADYAIKAAHAAASAGVWGFKVQMYTADSLTTKWADRYDHLPSSHATQYEAFSDVMEYDEWRDVKWVCDGYGVEFFASCFNQVAVDVCMDMGVGYFKVASGEITNTPLLRYIGSTGEKIILSTGASYQHEIESAINALTFHGLIEADDITLLACTLSYPAADGYMHRIRQLKKMYPFNDIGYSDHTFGVDSTWIAVALGATMLEKHFTITPGEGGDHDLGVTPTELHEMGMIANRAEALLWTPDIVQFGPEHGEAEARAGARRGVYYVEDMKAGDVFDWEAVLYLRPAFAGVTPIQAEAAYGGKMTRDVKAWDPFVPDDVSKGQP